MINLFQGKLVRLAAEEPAKTSKLSSHWSRDSEYLRLMDSDPATMWSANKYKSWSEISRDNIMDDEFFFNIRTLKDDKIIGFIGLYNIRWNHGDAEVGIGLGDREVWGFGYGTDSLRLILRFAFTELNLHRVSLGVFEYNPRAIRAYEKAGFREEGLERKRIKRDGSRTDELLMGVLQSEWEWS